MSSFPRIGFRRGKDSTEVETKPRAGGANPRRIQFGQINGEPAEDAVVEKAEQRQQQEDICIRPWCEKGDRQHHQAADTHQGKNPSPAKPIGQWTEAEITRQRADVEQHGRIADTAGKFGGTETSQIWQSADTDPRQYDKPFRLAAVLPYCLLSKKLAVTVV